MAFPANSSTELSLLERMGDSRHRSQAWISFLERYTQLFFFWFRRWGVDPNIMEDALQEAMVRVLGNLDGFERRRHGSFRVWLKTIARSSWKQLEADSVRQLALRKIDPQKAGALLQLQSKLAEETLVQCFDEWATEEILHMANSRVRRRVDPETWESYRQVAIEGQPLDSIVAQAGIPAGRIYARIFRVRRLLREEIAIIDNLED